MLFPFLPVWRRFRELDRHSSGECRAIVVNASVRFGLRAWPAWFVALGGAGAVLLLLGAVGYADRDARMLAAGDYSGFASLVVVWVGFPAFAAFVGGVLVRSMQAQWALKRLLRVSHCPRCGYTLEGLRPIEAPGIDPNPAGRKIRCPECGKLWGMLELGLTVMDLLPWEQRIPAPGVGKMRRPLGGHAVPR